MPSSVHTRRSNVQKLLTHNSSLNAKECSDILTLSNTQTTIETIELSFSESESGSDLTQSNKEKDDSRSTIPYFDSIAYLLKQHEKQEKKTNRRAALAQVRDKQEKKTRFLHEMLTSLDALDHADRKKLLNCTICSRHSRLSIVDNSSNCKYNKSFTISEKKSEDTAVETTLTIYESIVEKGEDTSTSTNIERTLPRFKIINQDDHDFQEHRTDVSFKEDQESRLFVDISFGESIIEVVLLLPIANEVPVINTCTQTSQQLSDTKIDNVVKKNIKVMLEQLGRCKYNKSNMSKNIRLKLKINMLHKMNELL